MDTFLQLSVNGAGKGAVYALLALGFVIIYRATGVVNFAHGSLVFVGGYVTYAMSDNVGFIAAAAIGILSAGLLLLFRYTSWGLAMRAQAENREAAALMGIRNSQITASAWVVAGLLAGIAVQFIATSDFSGSGVSRGTHALALVAFPAAVIGGLDSVGGAVLGGFIVGLTEAYASQYIALDFSKSAVFIVMLVVLVARPSGLFGSREVNRVCHPDSPRGLTCPC